MDIESGKIRVTLRLEPDIHSMLINAIGDTGRSLNSEINARIRDSLCNEAPVILTTTEKVFQRIICEELTKAYKP